ncbi:MAG: SRPBCC domain-containing protein [Vallitaleaceae bacterium]|nr:SRPBCC domain-containing protein [Vallitaleaceae bacterium]
MANNENPIVVETTKEYNVPVEKLYEAWNKEEQLKEWWHPFNKNISRVINELKPGGELTYEFEGDAKCQITGQYQEVVENKRLVYSWNWDLEHDEMKNGDYNLTIDFIPGQGSSRLNVRQEGFLEENATDIHKKGWDRGLEALRLYLEEQSISNKLSPGKGVNSETPKGEGKTMNPADITEQAVSQPELKAEVQPDSGKQVQNEAKPWVSASPQNETAEGKNGVTQAESNTETQPKSNNEMQQEVNTEIKTESNSDTHPGLNAEAKAEPQPAIQTDAKAEGEPEIKDESATLGKGPKPVGPNQQTWDNPKPGDELKKEIEDQLAKLKKLGEDLNEHDSKFDDLNKDQDIESKNQGPDHKNKSENNTQDSFDPAKYETEAPSH